MVEVASSAGAFGVIVLDDTVAELIFLAMFFLRAFFWSCVQLSGLEGGLLQSGFAETLRGLGLCEVRAVSGWSVAWLMPCVAAPGAGVSEGLPRHA